MHTRHAWLAAIAILVSASSGLAQQAADTILYNGKILTVDKNSSVAQAVAVRGDQIAAVGTDAEVLKLAGPKTVKIDLKGRTVTPGLINTHVHLEYVGGYVRELGAARSRTFPLNVRGLKTKDEVLQRIRDVIAAFKIPAGEWVMFDPNWTASQAPMIFGELNAKELDKAAPNNPIVMNPGMTPENINMVNGVALKELWRKYGDFLEKYGRYWVDDAGNPTGILEPPASRIAWEDEEFSAKGLAPKPEDVAPYFRKILMEDYVSTGTTTLSGSLNTSSVKAYELLDQKGDMPLRYAYGAMAAFQPGRDMKQFKIGGGTKNVFIASMSARATDGGGIRSCSSLQRDDASIQKAAGSGDSSDMNRVAALWFPKGQCNLDMEYFGGGGGGARGARISGNYFTEWYRTVATNGLRSSNSHVAGDRSVSMMIDAWEQIDKQKPGAVKGWTFDHCNLVNPKDIQRAAKLGLMFSCNPRNAVASNPASGGRSPVVAYVNGEEILHQYAAPFKAMVDAGVNVSLELEGGGNVWEAIETMVTRRDGKGKVWGAHNKVDKMTALRIATQNGANYIVKSNELGSLEAGKLADLVVLDKDYATIPDEQIGDIRPVLTMMGGKIWFLRTDFSKEYNLTPSGATISTYEELKARRPPNPDES
jgi:predicted amidohydrolase YtcJ